MADWQVKLCDSSLARVIPERITDEQLIIQRYTNKASVTFTSNRRLSTTTRLCHLAPTTSNRRTTACTVERTACAARHAWAVGNRATNRFLLVARLRLTWSPTLSGESDATTTTKVEISGDEQRAESASIYIAGDTGLNDEATKLKYTPTPFVY